MHSGNGLIEVAQTW